jgi:hypothetical protein
LRLVSSQIDADGANKQAERRHSSQPH